MRRHYQDQGFAVARRGVSNTSIWNAWEGSP